MSKTMQDSIENRFDKFSKGVVLDFVKYGEEEDNFYLSEVMDSAKQEILDFIISEISKTKEETIKDLVKIIENNNCDSISLVLLKNMNLESELSKLKQ